MGKKLDTADLRERCDNVVADHVYVDIRKDELSALLRQLEAMRVAIVYARDRRGGAFDFDTWIRLVESALRGDLPTHAIEEAQGEVLMYRQALSNVRAEVERLKAECEVMRPVFVAALEWFEAEHTYDANCRAGDCDDCEARLREEELRRRCGSASPTDEHEKAVNGG